MLVPFEYSQMMGEFKTSITALTEDIKDIKDILKDILLRLEEHSKLIAHLEYQQEENEKMRQKSEEEKRKTKEQEKEEKKRKQTIWDSVLIRIIGAILITVGGYYLGNYHEYLKYQEPPTHIQKIGLRKV